MILQMKYWGQLGNLGNPTMTKAKKIEHITSLDVGDSKDYLEGIAMK
jgi:hypothetical protein